MSARGNAVIALVAVVALGACADDSEASRSTGAAITNGADDAADPAVFALVTADGKVVCSGALVSPHVGVTAAHCGVGPSTFREVRAFFGAAVGGPGSFVALSDARVHPAFDAATFANDIALVTLAADAPAAPIAALDRPLDASFVSTPMRIVGFGATAPSQGVGKKRSGTATITAIDATTVDLVPGPSQPCAGDSGGPGFVTIGGVEVVAGVTSHGDAECVTHDVDTRIDAYVASFIAPYLASIAEGSARAGARCLYPAECVAGAACVTAADAPTIAYCAPACAKDADCPSGMTCATSESRCRFPIPTPGALGSACTTSGDCVDGDCIDGHVCSHRCVAASDCPSGYDCKNTSDIRFYCVASPKAPPTSSCALERAPARSGAAWGAALALVAIVARRRRR